MGILAAVHWFWKKDCRWRESGKKICDICARIVEGRTTLISQEMVCDAAKGFFIQPVVELIEGMLLGDKGLSENVQKLLGFGSNSGYFILKGIIEGMCLSLQAPCYGSDEKLDRGCLATRRCCL